MRAWRTRRRIAAVAQGAAVLALPFVRVGGESALRFDIRGMKLHAFGTVLWMNEFHLVLLGTLFLIAVTLALTVVFGRAWCGWICPQTVLPEIASLAASPLPGRWRRLGGGLVLVPLAALVSLSLIAFFLPPADIARDLFRSRTVTAFFLVQWAVVFLMAGVVGPRFCRTVCPYSMLQNVLFDDDTLAIAFDASRSEACLRCGECEAACPVKIDIRKGAGRECIACAECIDACRRSTSPKGLAPFVGYRGKLLRPKAALLAGGAAAAGAAFLLFLHMKPAVAFTVQWEAKAPFPSANTYRYTVRNDLGTPLHLALRLEGGGKMYGDKEIRVGAHSRTTGRVLVRREDEASRGVTFVAAGPGVTLKGKAGYP